jgi:hypothetical protein
VTNPQVAGAIETLNQGVRAVPSLRQGIGFTLMLAMLGASGRVVVPVVIQQAIDHGLHRSIKGSAQSVDISLVIKLCFWRSHLSHHRQRCSTDSCVTIRTKK